MALPINKYQKELGGLLGLRNVNSENDLRQINEFANYHQVKNVNSARDVMLLSPLVEAWKSRSTGAAAQGALPAAAAQGDSTPDQLQELLMKQSSDITQQETYFDQLLKQQQLEQQQQSDQLSVIRQQYETQQATQQAEFAKQQEAWNQELLAQQQKLNNTTNAAGSAPGAVAGWKPNTSGIKTLEELLMGSAANTSAMTSFSTVLA